MLTKFSSYTVFTLEGFHHKHSTQYCCEQTGIVFICTTIVLWPLVNTNCSIFLVTYLDIKAISFLAWCGNKAGTLKQINRTQRSVRLNKEQLCLITKSAAMHNTWRVKYCCKIHSILSYCTTLSIPGNTHIVTSDNYVSGIREYCWA